MKKIVIVLVMVLLIGGCSKETGNTDEGEIASLKQQLSVVSQKIETLNLEIANLKEQITKLQESQGTFSNQISCHFNQVENLSRCWFPMSQVGFVVNGQIPVQFRFIENFNQNYTSETQILFRYDDGNENDEFAQFFVGKLSTEEQAERGAKLISDLSQFKSIYSVVILDSNLTVEARTIIDQWLQSNYSTIQRNHTKYIFIP